jgi:DNA/RNA endonuclease G (NUC1)
MTRSPRLPSWLPSWLNRLRPLVLAAVAAMPLAPSVARADDTPQPLPFKQEWTDISQITVDDNWNFVAGIVGYRGDGLAGSTAVNPQTVLAASTVVDVNANRSDPNTFATGGVTEFQLTDPTVALNGSGTARAPYIQIHVTTVGLGQITVSYTLRDLDGSVDNAVQPVALQFRVGSTGNFTNVPAGFVADATAGGTATLVTHVSATLPPVVDNQPLVQVRIITTDAAGNDEWVGVDEIAITSGSGPINPSGVGAADPTSASVGASSLLTVSVTPGLNPVSTGLSVSADLGAIGGSSSQPFYDDGSHGDVTARDKVFSFRATVGTSIGLKTLPVTIADAQARSAPASIALRVQAPVTVVISQIYGGGGNTGATFHNDYVELYNAATAPFDLAGWTLQYAAFNGNGWAFTTQPLGGVIGPGQYFLVELAAGTLPDGEPLPPANIEDGGINMGATAGKIALVRNGAPLSGNCPLSDPDLVDFIGYGTTADCHEGAANAPAPSNTTALFRKSGGEQDTDDNGADFVTGMPEPRQTAPITEIGPAIFNTDPGFGAGTAPRDASITLNFTEPVDVDGAWYEIACAATGSHDDATTAVASGGKIHVITPNTNFEPGESCTVTIFKDQVHDQDDDDSAPNTDTLAANYVFSFTVVADTPAPYPPDVHLTMGNPSGAEADVNQPNNVLMEKKEFALSYNRDKGTPNWVSWHLSDDWWGDLGRVDTFRADPAVPPDWYRVQATDFLGTGFDRGHMTPNADRDAHDAISINQATFLMTNMVPQAPNNNQGAWADLENYLRSLTPANELYIVSGPAGIGGAGDNGAATTLANGHVTVPAFTWKVVLVLPKLSGDDVSRVDASTRTIAVIMPNTNDVLNTSDPNDWRHFDPETNTFRYLRSVDDVEALTGYDFFSEVPEIVQSSIEAGVNGVNPPGVANQLVTGEEDHDVSFTLQAVSSSSNPISFTILTPPAHGVLTGSDAGRTYTPAPDFNGTDSFTFRANDGVLGSNLGTVTIRVLEVNDPPVLTNVPASSTVELGGTLTFRAIGSDVDGDVLRYSLTGGFPTGATIDANTGAFVWTPTAAQVGATFTFEVVVTDGVASASATVTALTVDTTGPTITSLSASPNVVWPPNHKLVPVTVAVSATDAGGPTTCAVTSVTNNETGPRDAFIRGPLRLDVLAERLGGGEGRVYTIRVTCTDGSGNSAAATTTVRVPHDQGKK